MGGLRLCSNGKICEICTVYFIFYVGAPLSGGLGQIILFARLGVTASTVKIQYTGSLVGPSCENCPNEKILGYYKQEMTET